MAYQEFRPPTLWQTKITANDATAQEFIGAVRELADGRKYRYVKMTGGALALGKLVKPAAVVSVTNMTSANGTGPDGATTTLITDADLAATADLYKDYYFQLATAMTGSTEP